MSFEEAPSLVNKPLETVKEQSKLRADTTGFLHFLPKAQFYYAEKFLFLTILVLDKSAMQE
jgi:hypothetical protein